MPERVIIGTGILDKEGLSYGRGEEKALAEHLSLMRQDAAKMEAAAARVRAMLEDGRSSYGPGEDEALREDVRTLRLMGPDTSRVALAVDMLQIAGAMPQGILIEHPEGSAAATAVEWLIGWRRLAAAAQRVSAGDTGDAALSDLVRSAEELGRLQERFFWRHGADRVTGAPPEKLALQSRKNRTNLLADPDGGKKSANDERHAEAEEGWRQVAREAAATSSVGGKRLEERILAELKRRGFPARSGGRIREAIKGIRP